LAALGDYGEFVSAFPYESFMYLHRFKSLVEEYHRSPGDISDLAHEWYYGPSGSGKSRAARDHYPALYLKPTSTKWWPNYRGEETVLIDDIDVRDEHVLKWLKTWSDHYPFQAETKGGHTGLIRPKRILVTSQYLPDHITTNQELRDAINRRFSVVRFGGEDYEPVSTEHFRALVEEWERG